MSRTRPVSEGFLESNVTKLVTHNDQKTNALRAIKSKLLGDSGNSTGSGNEEHQDGKKIDSIQVDFLEMSDLGHRNAELRVNSSFEFILGSNRSHFMTC